MLVLVFSVNSCSCSTVILGSGPVCSCKKHVPLLCRSHQHQFAFVALTFLSIFEWWWFWQNLVFKFLKNFWMLYNCFVRIECLLLKKKILIIFFYQISMEEICFAMLSRCTKNSLDLQKYYANHNCHNDLWKFWKLLAIYYIPVKVNLLFNVDWFQTNSVDLQKYFEHL